MAIKSLHWPSILYIAFISLFLLHSPSNALADQPRLRPAKITVLIDRDLWGKEQEGKKQEAQEIINFVTERFEKEFGLTFTLDDIRPWDFPNKNGEINNVAATYGIIKQAANYKTSDVILGLTDKKLYECENQTQDEILIWLSLIFNGWGDTLSCEIEKRYYANGFAELPGKTALSEFKKNIVLHEIGHLFGAEHFSNDESIMNPVVGENITFDPANKEIIRQQIKEKFSIQDTP